MRLLIWLPGLVLALVAVVFATANRAPVRFDLWPLPLDAELPLYLAVLVPLAAGLLAGFVLGWASGFKARVRAGVQRRRAESLQRQLDAARQSPPQS